MSSSMDTDDLPLALRRPRRISGVVPVNTTTATASTTTTSTTPRCRRLSTPTPRKSRKRVRFSDPGPVTHTDNGGLSTGLTPSLRRTTMMGLSALPALPASPSTPSRRRRSAPTMDTPPPRTLTFLPLRQILDGRVQRRIRRNGLSEEMNTVLREKRQRARVVEELRAMVAAKDEEIQRLQLREQAADANVFVDPDPDTTIPMDTDRVLALEREVAALRGRLGDNDDDDDDDDDAPANWTMAARDPFADYDDITDDTAFHEASLADVLCSTPPPPPPRKTVDYASFAGSFPTPPATSPVMAGMGTPTETTPTPTAPCTPTGTPLLAYHSGSFLGESAATTAVRHLLTPSPPTRTMADAEVQTPGYVVDAEEADRLRDELAALQRETAALAAELAAYEGWTKALDAQLPHGTTDQPAEKSSRDALTQRIADVLRALADKTAVLAELSTQVCALAPAPAGEAPGDGDDAASDPSPADPSPADPSPADPFAALARHAAAARAARLALEHLAPGESTLRLTVAPGVLLPQLRAVLLTLVDERRKTDSQIDEYHALERSLRRQLGDRVAAMDGLAAEAADAAVALDRMKGALASYARDVQELEGWSQQLEGRAVAAEEAQQRAAAALALRDARVAELRAEIDRVNAALRAAHEAAQPLRVANAGLRQALETERARTAACRRAVAALQAELREGDDEDNGPATEAQQPSTATTARTTPARKRRRYDSGLGFLEEEEEEA